MKTFSMVKLFTIFCLSTFILLAANIADVQAQGDRYSLEVAGDKDQKHTEGDQIDVTFVAKESNEGSKPVAASGKNLIITITQTPSNILSSITVEGRRFSTNPMTVRTNINGTVNVLARAEKQGVVTIKAEWQGLTADATLTIEPPLQLNPSQLLLTNPILRNHWVLEIPSHRKLLLKIIRVKTCILCQ